MEKLLIVDGMNLLFQMFYGMTPRFNSAGRPIHGTVGFIGALLKILRWEKPSHAVVLFDGECTNERKELDENYKANRPDYSQLPEEETPFCQLPHLYKALDVLGIRHAETVCCETDDWIAGYAKTYGSTYNVVIVSQDSDFFQLISPKVLVLRYRGDKTTLWSEHTVYQQLGVRPGQYADFKALVGDSADNIPGAPKIGPKTAAALISRFGSLQQILEQTASVEKPSIRASLEENRDQLLLNQKLITLTGCCSLPFTPEELPWRDRGLNTYLVLQSIDLI